MVWFTGSTALVKGQGLCYDQDRGTAASADATRGSYVELPSASNNLWFAGVADMDYPARTGGQMIKINLPGSVCEVAVSIGCTVGSTVLTCSAATGDAGRFSAAGFRGEGTGAALQTVSTTTSTTDPNVVLSSSLDGSATYTTSSLTVTKTAAFTYAAAGDYVYVVGGGTTASSAAVLTPARYTIASVTSADAVVLSTAPGAADSKIAFYCVRGNPTALVKLDPPGTPSGLTEFVSTYTDGSGTTAITAMVGGYTNFTSATTLSNGDDLLTLADGLWVGMRKAFKLRGAITTNDILLTVTNGRLVNPAGADINALFTTLATIEFDADADYALLEWSGTAWVLLDYLTVTVAAS